MADVLHIHTDILLREIERLKRIYPELEDDPQLLANTIEGSTNADNVLTRITQAFLENTALKEANAMLQSDLRERGQRFDRKAEAYRALAYAVMQASGRRMAVLPVATLSIAKGRAKLVIDDESVIPQGYVKIERTPMRADIARALGNGDAIPGARLEESEPHLSVRTK